MMSYPLPSKDLHAWLAWIKTIRPLEIGTIIQFKETITFLNVTDQWKPNSCFKIKNLRPSYHNSSQYKEEKYGKSQMVYDMVLCTQSGREYKKTFNSTVESIQRQILDGKVVVISE